jgi:hypothetical protein
VPNVRRQNWSDGTVIALNPTFCGQQSLGGTMSKLKRGIDPAKILEKVSKKGGPHIEVEGANNTHQKNKSNSSSVAGLKEQYTIIREDIIKLREDLTKGYDMAKGMMDKGVLRSLLKTK